MTTTTCDTCMTFDDPRSEPMRNDARWLVFAAYDDQPMEMHPTLKRYPAAMASVCDDHLGSTLTADGAAPGSTRMWVVKPL